MLKIVLDIKIKSKPTGKLNEHGTIYMGSDYQKWKKKAIAQAKTFINENWEPPKRCQGLYIILEVPKTAPGHPPDTFNLEGAIADVLTQAGIWQDDNINVIDRKYLKTIRVNGRTPRTQIMICETLEEFALLILNDPLISNFNKSSF